ncbi:hypothetical protein EB815_30845 [Mesorhizobium loti]|nr:hypothetical protein EB815_30845 [Mesorhizobium loti]
MRAVGIPCNLVLDLTLTDRPDQSQEDRAMIGHIQGPLDGSVEREDHEIVAARHEIGRDKDMVDQRLEGRLDAGDLLVRSILRGERGQAGGGQRGLRKPRLH